MSLMRLTFQRPIARLVLAVALICALLVTQFGLTRHVVDHAANPIITTSTADTPSGLPDNASCLICLEHQAHGAGLISAAITIAAQAINAFERQALAPNTPYLAPERASQRAPPVLS